MYIYQTIPLLSTFYLQQQSRYFSLISFYLLYQLIKSYCNFYKESLLIIISFLFLILFFYYFSCERESFYLMSPTMVGTRKSILSYKM